MKKTNHKFTAILATCLTNLLISGLALAEGNVNGNISVGNCLSNCLTINTPDLIKKNDPIFLEPQGGKIFFHFLYPLEKAQIADSNTEGGFTLTAKLTPFTNTTYQKEINYTDIGIISFNNSSNKSTDATPEYRDVTSLIDPVSRNIISEPFSLSELISLENENNTNKIDSYYTYFQGQGAISDDLTLFQTNTFDEFLGLYNFGLGFVVKTPTNPELSIVDGIYQSTLTLTIIDTPPFRIPN